MNGDSDPARAAASILWRLACVEQQLDRMRRALRRSQPYSPAHLYAAIRDNGSVRLYASAWVKLLRLYGVRADGLDGRLLAARLSSRDDGVSLADFLRWTRPSVCVSPCGASNLESTTLAVSQKEPEEVVAYMGLLEVEAAADVAAAATAARGSCRGQCVPCTLYNCIDTSKTGTVTEADLARAMAVLQQPSFSAVSRVFNRLDRRSKGSLTAADWAVEFLHTEVACKCIQRITTTGLATSLESLGLLTPSPKENENCLLLQSDSPSYSSPRSKHRSLQQAGQGNSASPRGRCFATNVSPQNFAFGSRTSERPRVLSAGTGSRRVCPVCLLPKIRADACTGTAATATAKVSFSKPRGAFRGKCSRQSYRQPSRCSAHACCASRNPDVRSGSVWTHRGTGDVQDRRLCMSLPSKCSHPCCSLYFAPQAAVATSAEQARYQNQAYVEKPGGILANQNYCAIGATDEICTCKSKARASSAMPNVVSASYISQPMQSDQARPLPPLSPSGPPEHCSSSLNAMETPLETQRLSNFCVAKTNHLFHDMQLPTYTNNAGKLLTTPPTIKPQTVTNVRPATPAPLYTGSCPHCASRVFPKATVASFPTLPNTRSAVGERYLAPEQPVHGQHPKDQSVNGLQQNLSCTVLQQLRTEIQQQIQEQVQQKLQIYMQQIPSSTNQKSGCQQSEGAQTPISPQHGVSQNKGSPKHAGMDFSTSQHVGIRCSSQTPATGSATPVLSLGRLAQTPGTSTLKRSRSGPVNGTFQHLDPVALPSPVPEACMQRMQWLQSWSSEAQESKEKQLLATLKELNTRPDFALVDVWRVFDPEGAGISEARGVQDGFSRLGIRCSSEEAQCFIWYYCPPHPIGLFAAGGDEQLPLLRCIQQQNPSTVPAAYLALSSRTRKLLATFLRLALDKAISRWLARSLKASGLTATAAVPGNITVC